MQKIFTITSLILVAFILWQLSDIVLLIFAAVLMAILLRSISIPIEKHTCLSSRLSLAATIAGISILIVLTIGLMGTTVSDQLSELMQQLPEAWQKFKTQWGNTTLGRRVFEQINNIEAGEGFVLGISTAAASIINGITYVVLIVFGGIYFALQPSFYRNGILQLVPKSAQKNISETMQLSWQALRLWLMGQLMSMAVVGVLITTGLLILGLPSAIALGILAGLGEFIPLIGTTFALLPALLLAITEGGSVVLWTIAIYLCVQQVQGNIIMPLIQRRVVQLPPVLTLFSIVSFTILFGALGLFLAAPLTVFFFVLVKKLYIRDLLKHKTSIPGENGSFPKL